MFIYSYIEQWLIADIFCWTLGSFENIRAYLNILSSIQIYLWQQRPELKYHVMFKYSNLRNTSSTHTLLLHSRTKIRGRNVSKASSLSQNVFFRLQFKKGI